MSKSDHLYLTTTLPYVNAKPHIGFAFELIQADAVARVYRALGKKVLLNFGTDEHGLKIYRKAQEEGIEPQAYVDGLAVVFKELANLLTIDEHVFVRTTDEHHKMAAKAFWLRCEEAGDIYKKNYTIKYCVGCELEKTDSELVDGKCHLHPTAEMEDINEENYFFRFSQYQEKLLELYKNNPLFIVPNHRQYEMVSFVESGLEDFSISRLKEKMPWGVPVPTDDAHVMYVWFDALVNYISTIGWPDRVDEFDSWWPVIQFAGKDNLRQQAAMWQAMLMSAGIATSKQVVIHGFITIGGQKMSKSLGNVVDPVALVDEFGTDAVRYFMLREMHPTEDSDFTRERFIEAYNANLANGIGNLTSRVMKMATSYLEEKVAVEKTKLSDEFVALLCEYRFSEAADYVWGRIGSLDERIAREEPFKIVKEDKPRAQQIVAEMVYELYAIAQHLEPLLPTTAVKIETAIWAHQMPESLFKRIEE